jgi:cobalt-precorrin-5B (C1)-methyltransferase
MSLVNTPRSGYTLPVFACAAAVAALRCLQQGQDVQSVLVDLIEPAQTVEIPIEQTAGIREGMALAITRSDPGDNLDLTRNTPVWALVEWREGAEVIGEAIVLMGGIVRESKPLFMVTHNSCYKKT